MLIVSTKILISRAIRLLHHRRLLPQFLHYPQLFRLRFIQLLLRLVNHPRSLLVSLPLLPRLYHLFIPRHLQRRFRLEYLRPNLHVSHHQRPQVFLLLSLQHLLLQALLRVLPTLLLITHSFMLAATLMILPSIEVAL